MKGNFPPALELGLSLADGCLWTVTAGDTEAAPIISLLGDVMQLSVIRHQIPSLGVLRRLLVTVDAQISGGGLPVRYVPLPSEGDGVIRCVLPAKNLRDRTYSHLMRFSAVIACDSERRGGILLHGALAERDGVGVILAAPGGTGKTTASNRLPSPWRSLCDDTTLVVRDPSGNYMAHPWPTWSRFLLGGGDGAGTWDVQGSVPLTGIFILSRAAEDRGESIGVGQAVGLLVQSAQQGSQLMSRGLGEEEIRILHKKRFNNLCDMAKSIPAYLLHISQAGPFWREIERVLKL